MHLSHLSLPRNGPVCRDKELLTARAPIWYLLSLDKMAEDVTDSVVLPLKAQPRAVIPRDSKALQEQQSF